MSKKFLFFIVLLHLTSVSSVSLSDIIPIKKPVQSKEITEKKLLIDVLRPLPKPIEKEVEEFLYTHPDIQEVQVFGIPDERYGEIVCAWVQLKQNATLNEEGVKSFCRDQITHFKVPSLVRFVDEFPMTVTGKIQKFKMRETMIEQLVHV